MSRSRPAVAACWLGSVPYRDAWALQRQLVESLRAGRGTETLLLLEHPHVFTLGRRATEENVLWDEATRRQRDVEMVWCDRGGDVTYHGPGQLVGYPILDLRHHGGDILAFIRSLEISLINYLATLVIEASAVPGLTGVWSGGAKVAAIGIRLTESVVSHGFALNLTTDLDYFAGIVPCGLRDKQVGSVRSLTGAEIATEAAARAYAAVFGDTFGCRVEWVPATTLMDGQPESAVPHRRELPVLSSASPTQPPR